MSQVEALETLRTCIQKNTMFPNPHPYIFWCLFVLPNNRHQKSATWRLKLMQVRHNWGHSLGVAWNPFNKMQKPFRVVSMWFLIHSPSTSLFIVSILFYYIIFFFLLFFCYQIGMPQDTYNIWSPFNYPFTQKICILQGLLSETSTNATVLTITSFTIERYIAICHPFRFVYLLVCCCAACNWWMNGELLVVHF